jgi:mRNA-degrading endonuclease HigB of HigAB toxin-antitoxin module
MIREFHEITKDTLHKEITALKGVIPNSEWEAIDGLRKLGNIGAHMENDVNLIVDISEGEADSLIAFIEYLFKQWYVKRHDDQENLASVQALAGIKQAQRKTQTKVVEVEKITAIKS